MKEKLDVVDKIKEEIVDFVGDNQEEDWIIGFPIKTKYGYIRQVKVSERSRFSNQFNFLKLQGWQVQSEIIKFVKGKDIEKDVISIFKRSSFITCIQNNFQNLRATYKGIFDDIFVGGFNEDMFFTMTQSDFDNLRYLILDINSVSYRKVNPNKEIDRFDRMKYRIAQGKGQVIGFDTMFTTLMTKEGGGHTPNDILDFTLRQFSHAFKRVEFIKGNETSTLYKTVDSKNKIDVVDWFKSTLSTEVREKTYNSIDDLKGSKNAFINNK